VGDRAGTADYMVHTLFPEKKKKKSREKNILDIVVNYRRRRAFSCVSRVLMLLACTLLSLVFSCAQSEYFEILLIFLVFLLEDVYICSRYCEIAFWWLSFFC
jgi:hypothetical protein